MGKIVETIVRLIRADQKAYAKKWSFFGVFLCAFFVSVAFLSAADLLPNPMSTSVEAAPDTGAATNTNASKTITAVAFPTKIEIAKIGLVAIVVNPTTATIAILDNELLKGAVRYPASAKLGEAGNVVLFGHSSYLPVVNNQAYKTFNGIQKLVGGDTVIVYSSDAVYTYRVRNIAKENAMSNEGISLETTGRTLTLVTCNSFGAKEDRFVVTADFVESHAVSG